MSKDPLQQEEFLAWKAHPTTRKVLEALRQQREEVKEELAQGDYSRPDPAQMSILTAAAISECQTLGQVIEMDYEGISEIYSRVKA